VTLSNVKLLESTDVVIPCNPNTPLPFVLVFKAVESEFNFPVGHGAVVIEHPGASEVVPPVPDRQSSVGPTTCTHLTFWQLSPNVQLLYMSFSDPSE